AITAFSTDPNGPAVTYSLSDDAGGRFAINATTGVVTVADSTKLNYEDNTSHTRSEERRVGTEPTTAQTLNIQVTDVNPTTPVRPQDATVGSDAEGAAYASALAITAFSTDPNGPAVTYSLSDDAGGRFAINATTGVVTVADSTKLNYEDNTSHT